MINGTGVFVVLVDPPMAQEEGKSLLALAAQVVGSGFAGPDQIAHSLVDHFRHPHPDQFARPMQSRQRDRVPPVGLDALARPLRDQAGAPPCSRDQDRGPAGTTHNPSAQPRSRRAAARHHELPLDRVLEQLADAPNGGRHVVGVPAVGERQ